ncbi:MAG: hypothetical protein ACXW4A_05870, partial [Nitrospira sp.]
EKYARIREMLTKKFGGLSTYTRAPTEGLWKDERNAARHDDMVILEVMAEARETMVADYKKKLNKRSLRVKSSSGFIRLRSSDQGRD